MVVQPKPYDAAATYRQHSQMLADAIKAGQITPERARQLQAPLFAAVKMGSTPEGQNEMAYAFNQVMDGMPMANYDAAAQYRNFGRELLDLVNSGKMTVAEANALKAPAFEAVRLGNTNQGSRQMELAIQAARQKYMPPVTQPSPFQGAEGMLGKLFGPKPDPYNIDHGNGIVQPAIPPKFIGKNFTGDAPPPGKKYIETGEGLVPVPINDTYVKPQGMTKGLGSALGAQGMTGMPIGEAVMPAPPQMPQMPQMPAPMPLPVTPPPSPSPAQPTGMALGGLMAKYRGGMC
jgi:polyhydroxyalkanoate synthesis regulator phasin